MLRQNIKVNTPLLFSTKIVREVEMEVVFGTPSKNCSGAGICLIASSFPEGYKIPCPHTRAIIHYLPGNEIVFRFQKRNLSITIIETYFNKKNFQVEEPFSLPKALVKQWNLPFNTIPAGNYTIEKYAQEWRLYFSF